MRSKTPILARLALGCLLTALSAGGHAGAFDFLNRMDHRAQETRVSPQDTATPDPHASNASSAIPASKRVSSKGAPDWFGQYSEPGLVIGFGQDDSRDVAIAYARKQIAEELKVSVRSSEQLQLENKQGKVRQSYSAEATTSSDQVLTDTAVIRDQLVGRIWYVAVAYDNGTLPQRVWRRTRRMPAGSACEAPDIPRAYRRETPIGAELAKSSGPTCEPNFSLVRQRSGWAVKLGEELVSLRPDDAFGHYWFPNSDMSSHELALTLTPRQITNGDRFELRIRSTENGYVTLYNVFGDGFVSELASNVPIRAGELLEFPGAFLVGRDLMGVLENPNVASSELYIAVFNVSPPPNARHSITASRIDNSDAAATMDELIGQLDRARFSLGILRINPR